MRRSTRADFGGPVADDPNFVGFGTISHHEIPIIEGDWVKSQHGHGDAKETHVRQYLRSRQVFGIKRVFGTFSSFHQ